MALFHHTLVTSVGLLAVVVGPVEAQWQEQVNTQLRQMQAVLEERGYQRSGEVQTGATASGDPESISLTLRGGQEYVIAGVCDDDCSDLDLRLYDRGGNELAEDIELDAWPILEYAPSASGDFRVQVVMVTCSVSPCFYGVGLFAKSAVGERIGLSGPMFRSGTLSWSDDSLTSGEYADSYSFEGRQGEHVVIDLRSSEFDPYLILRMPGGDQEENDDHEGDASRSLISLTLPKSGSYDVLVTSYRPGETGAYALEIEAGAASAPALGPRIERGRLTASDGRLRSGEYMDVYQFEGRPGVQVKLDLTSAEFDTYLILQDPTGEQTENDDTDRPGHSQIEHDLTELGTYRVLVTSYEEGESGAYELSIDLREESPSAVATRDVVSLTMGGSATGSLVVGDGQLGTGEFRDLFVFDGVQGQTVAVELSSSEFDTYLMLVTPDGETIANDDYDGSTSRSRIDLTLRETGRYRVVATSYKAGETGSYIVGLTQSAAFAEAAVTPTEPGTAGTGQTYGIFMGISDYGGRANNLAYTADDAVRVRDAFVQSGMPSGNGIVLTDASATTAAFRQAVSSLSQRVGPADQLVFFFSGHGGRVPRSDFQPADPDALDETLEFYDGGILDDEMREILDGLPVGRTILLFDACFSGGFSKDVIAVPGRMGMFSSEEDVTSAVAAKFRAGGYLSLFLADAIGDRLADADGDGELTAIELSQYVHERYRADVKSGTDDFVRTGGPQMGYQHLVVDRGSIGPYDVLFRW
jgi:hypothetical protein